MAKLTSKRRGKLRKSSFAVPSQRKYPIHDKAHAINALARSKGKKSESTVRRAVLKRYPSLKKG